MITVRLEHEELAALTELHTVCLQSARDHERAARRLRLDDPNRSEMCADKAATARDQAAALAKLLAERGVVCPDSRQLALWSDGGPS